MKNECLNTGNISTFRLFQPRVMVRIKVTEDKDVRRWMEKKCFSILSVIMTNILQSSKERREGDKGKRDR